MDNTNVEFGFRIRQLRNELGLTQTEFAKKIGLVQNTMTKYENGLRNASNQIVISICREFNVNENWLRTGNGEMFISVPQEDEYFRAAASISKDNDALAMQIIIDYWKLSKERKQLFKDYILNLAERIKETE